MKLVFIPLFILLTVHVWSQQLIFNENFNNGIPASWYLLDSDNLTPAAAVDTFDNAWISFIHNGDTCAASTSFYNPSGQCADYLITPRISINAFSKLVWSAKSYDGSYPDGYLVMISTTDSLISSFTDTLLIEDAQIPYWQNRSVQLDVEGYANEDIFIAFKNITTRWIYFDDRRCESAEFNNASVNSDEMNSFQVYPNPFTNSIHVNGVSGNSVISVYTMHGNMVHQTSEADIDLSFLPAGMYTCRISSENNVENLILVKE